MDSHLIEELHNTLNDLQLFHLASDKSVMARHGLRRVRFYMLRHLYQNPGISITQLGTLSFTDPGNTSRMVYGMEQKGLVQRRSNDNDRRLYVLSLTDAGKELYEKANADLTVDIQSRFATIAPEELAGLLQSAQRLSLVLSQHLDEQDAK